ncbi:MAG: SDR family oxidoreductase [Alphaproteobacteria bacterium]|nr:SDR family oxidoreductase [Alphaproteobacteria bacterium]
MPTILITGANRGIGLEAARQFAAAGWTVHACCRDPAKADALKALKGTTIHALDVADFDAIDALARRLKDIPIDVLLNNAGKNARVELGKIDYDNWAELFRVNTMAPLRLAESFVEHLARSTKKLIINISSIMGSIADSSGKWYPYRSSKSALNMVSKCLSVDLAPRGITVLSVHPGWVRTDMGGPTATVSPEDSVAGIKALIDRATPAVTGRFYAFDGKELPW